MKKEKERRAAGVADQSSVASGKQATGDKGRALRAEPRGGLPLMAEGGEKHLLARVQGGELSEAFAGKVKDGPMAKADFSGTVHCPWGREVNLLMPGKEM